jgi:hypothetical protein
LGIKKSILPVLASIIILGSLGMVQQSYATIGEVLPNWDRKDDCAATHLFNTFGTLGDPTNPGSLVDGGACSAGTLNTDPALNDAFCEITTATVDGRACHIHVPNFDDPFNTKLLRVNVFWSGDNQPAIFNVKPSGATDNCIFENQVIVNSGYFYEDWRCHPNPDNERIWFTLDTRTNIDGVVVDSISFDRQAVGGNIIPLDSTMVLVAGTQTTAAWMIPAIVSAIGIGIVLARRF